jgi:phosphoribosylpyrophosphate synthetase
LWRFLTEHERCIARAAHTDRFQIITTVPSGDIARDDRHPLRHIVGELVGPTRQRHQRVLRRSAIETPSRTFSASKFEATAPLDNESILLIDDTWTTGSSAQSAAAALKAAGAGRTAAVVIGRHLNREWHENDRRIRGIARPFAWGECAVCANAVAPALQRVEVPGYPFREPGYQC